MRGRWMDGNTILKQTINAGNLWKGNSIGMCVGKIPLDPVAVANGHIRAIFTPFLQRPGLIK